MIGSPEDGPQGKLSTTQRPRDTRSLGQKTELFNRAERAFYLILDHHFQPGETRPTFTPARYYSDMDTSAIGWEWMTDDLIRRSIQLRLEQGRDQSYAMPVIADAEREERESDGSGVRHTKGEIFESLKPPFRTRALERALDRAYITASSWTEEDLTGLITISPRDAIVNREEDYLRDARGIYPRMVHLPTRGVGHIYLQERTIAKVVELTPDIHLTYDANGEVIGIGLSNLSH